MIDAIGATIPTVWVFKLFQTAHGNVPRVILLRPLHLSRLHQRRLAKANEAGRPIAGRFPFLDSSLDFIRLVSHQPFVASSTASTHDSPQVRACADSRVLATSSTGVSIQQHQSVIEFFVRGCPIVFDAEQSVGEPRPHSTSAAVDDHPYPSSNDHIGQSQIGRRPTALVVSFDQTKRHAFAAARSLYICLSSLHYLG